MQNSTFSITRRSFSVELWITGSVRSRFWYAGSQDTGLTCRVVCQFPLLLHYMRSQSTNVADRHTAQSDPRTDGRTDGRPDDMLVALARHVALKSGSYTNRRNNTCACYHTLYMPDSISRLDGEYDRGYRDCDCSGNGADQPRSERQRTACRQRRS